MVDGLVFAESLLVGLLQKVKKHFASPLIQQILKSVLFDNIFVVGDSKVGLI